MTAIINEDKNMSRLVNSHYSAQFQVYVKKTVYLKGNCKYFDQLNENSGL